MLYSTINDYEDYVHCKINGDTMSFMYNSSYIKYKNNINKVKAKDNYNKRNKEENIDDIIDNILDEDKKNKNKKIKKIKRSNRDLVRTVASLVIKPTHFISLTFKNDDGVIELSHDDAKSYLLKFVKAMKKEYKESWYILISDFGYINKLHFHVFLYINDKSDKDNKKLTRKVKKSWNDTIDSDSDTTDVADFSYRELNYQTFAKEMHKRIELEKELGSSKRFTKKFIPKDNRHPELYIPITLIEMDRLQGMIMDYFYNLKQNPKSELDQLIHKLGMVSFIPYETYKAMFDKIIADRKGKSFEQMLEMQKRFLINRERKRKCRMTWDEI